MARHLFEYISYDLDRQEIIDFRLKGWADWFLVLRTPRYAEETKDNHQGDDRRILPMGLDVIRLSFGDMVQERATTK